MPQRTCVRSRPVSPAQALGARTVWLAVSLALGAASACDDTGTGANANPDATVAAGGRPSVTDQGAGGGAGGRLDLALVDLGVADAANAGGARADAAGACDPALRRCVVQGEPAVEVCGPDGRAALEFCPEGGVCLGAEGRCAPDPTRCAAGERLCLDAHTPAECVPGEGWRAEQACPDDGGCGPGGVCVSQACAVSADRRSYLGCDFLALDLPNIAYSLGGGTPESPMGVVVANPERSRPVRLTARDAHGALAALVAEVVINPPLLVGGGAAPVTVATELRDATGQIVERAFGTADGLEIPPGGLAVLLFPHGEYFEETRVGARAWQLSTDEPVVAYQFGPYCCNFSYSNDASLLLPTTALGTDYLNVGVPSWADRPTPEFESTGIPATLTIVGTAPGTEVTIELPPDGAVLPPRAGSPVRIQGGRITATLGRGEVLDLMSERPQLRGEDPWGVDLTGARIQSTAPVAVFTGHICSFYPQSQGACDHLEEQLFPVDTWGDRYLLAPTKLRTQVPMIATEATFWKFVAAEPVRVTLSAPFDALAPSPPGFLGVTDCRERLDDERTIVLAPGEACEFGSRAAFSATGDVPFSVLGIMSGEASTGLLPGGEAGDPSIFLPPPERQLRFTYTFLAPGTYESDYVTIVAPLGAQITLDDAPLDLSGASAVQGEDWIYAHVLLEDGPHFMAGDLRFGIVVYAYDDWVSYAFTGGLDLLKR